MSWKETIAADEDTRFELYAQRIVTMQKKHGNGGALKRGLHAKGHGILEATLEIAADVPEQARHGLFAKPGTYEALVRFSNGSGKVQPDKVGDVRGLAIKVLGVDGEKVLGNAPTQDFLAVLSPALPFKNPDEFMAVVWALRSPPLALFRIVGSLGFRAFPLLKKLAAGLKVPPASLAAKRFYSGAPIQCGPHAVRFSFIPIAGGDSALPAGADAYAEDLGARLRRAPIAYDMAVQFFVDEATTPIEDTSVDWSSPYVKVGKLEIKQQDVTSERSKRLTERGEQLSFDPWHALVAHKPLGAIMRARKHAYYASIQARAAAAEPASIAALLG